MREKILAVIEKNSRISTAELAEILGENEAAVAAEIAKMEEEHVICGYHTLINWDNTEEEKVIALIEVNVTPQRQMGFDKIAERLSQYSEVKSVYLMSGAYDFTVILEEKTMRAPCGAGGNGYGQNQKLYGFRGAPPAGEYRHGPGRLSALERGGADAGKAAPVSGL